MLLMHKKGSTMVLGLFRALFIALLVLVEASLNSALAAPSTVRQSESSVKFSAMDHVAITVHSLQDSYDFYHRAFGFSIFHKWTTTWMIVRNSSKIGLFERPNAKPTPDIDGTIAIQHFAFRATPREFAQAQIRLKALKIPFDGPEDTGVADSIFVKDPDGHQVELTAYHR